MSSGNKLYIIQYNLMATSLSDAKRKAKHLESDEIWISESWKNGQDVNLSGAIGFSKE